MKKLSFGLVGTGLLLVALSLWADALGIGGDQGIGGTQFLGILSGAALAVLGVGSLTVEWGEMAGFRGRFRLEKIADVPILFWVLATFLVTYVSFFLLPVFFSGLQIQYLTKYIPDAFITHIGFDIEAIVTRIESWLTTGQSPYMDGFIAYPPLTIAIFSTFSILAYPAYVRLMVALTALAYLGVALILPWGIVPKQNRTLLLLFFITGLFSYGLQFEQERGQFNLIAFAFTLSAIYIFHFHPKLRFFAYVLFTLSIQLKVYPIFFIVMFVDDWRDWRAILKRFLGLGLVNLLLLFTLGYKIFLDFLRAITEYQFLESSRVENLSIKGFAYYLSNDVFGKANSLNPTVAEISFWLLLGGCFCAVIGYAIVRNSRELNFNLFVVCTIAALIIPSVSNDYKLSLLIFPVALLLSCLPDASHLKQKPFMIVLVVLFSLAYWTTLYPATVKPEFLGRNFPALIIILISATVLNFLPSHPSKTTVQPINPSPEVEP